MRINADGVNADTRGCKCERSISCVIQKSIDVANENTNILPPVPQVVCDSRMPDICSTTIQLRADQIDIRCDEVTCETKVDVFLAICSRQIHRGLQPMALKLYVLPNLTHIQIALV